MKVAPWQAAHAETSEYVTVLQTQGLDAPSRGPEYTFPADNGVRVKPVCPKCKSIQLVEQELSILPAWQTD